MRTVPIHAYLFAVFSFAAAFLWPSKPDLIPYMPFTPVVWFSCLGMIALSVSRFYGVRHAVPAPELYIFIYTFVLVVFINSVPFAIHPRDKYLLFFDYNFAYCGMAVAKLYRSSKAAGVILGLTYNSLMFAITAGYLALPGTPLRRRFVLAVILAGILILPLYLICPGAGPKALFAEQFPWTPDLSGPPPTVSIPHVDSSPAGMNAMPSGHFAWALLLFWFTRRHCRAVVGWVFAVYAALTVLATLGTGEHWVVDLVVSVPFAAGIWAVVHRKWRFSAVALVAVLAWVVALGQGWLVPVPPPVAWLLIASTISFFGLTVIRHDPEVPVPATSSAASAVLAGA